MSHIFPSQSRYALSTDYGKPAGNLAVASCSGWARMAQDGGCRQEGYGWYPFNKICKSEYLEYQWLGLDPPPSDFPSDSTTCIPAGTILQFSYGMVRLGTTPDAQTTCDESQNGTPSRPEDESTGVYKIVKSYRIRNLDTNVLTDKGTYIKPDSSPNITIEDESIFKLVAWKTSTQFEPGIVSTKWESTVPAVHKQSGTTPTTIEMKAPETTLYLSGWENVTTTGLKEPLAKQAALMYNLLRKVDRTRSSDLPSVNLIFQKK